LPPICPRCAGRQPAAVDAATAGAVQRPIVTWALASACVIVFLLMIADGASVFEPSADQVLAWGGDFGPATLRNDWWRLVTATFILYNLLYGFGKSGIDNAAHLGGLVAGAALGMALPFATTAARQRALRLWLSAVGACVAIAVGFTQVRRHNAPLAAFGTALSDIDAGRVERGIERLRAVVAERPDFAPAQYALGSAYLQHENPAEAIPTLRAAARLVPNDLEYQNDLGVALLRHHQADSAIAVFER